MIDFPLMPPRRWAVAAVAAAALALVALGGGYLLGHAHAKTACVRDAARRADAGQGLARRAPHRQTRQGGQLADGAARQRVADAEGPAGLLRAVADEATASRLRRAVRSASTRRTPPCGSRCPTPSRTSTAGSSRRSPAHDRVDRPDRPQNLGRSRGVVLTVADAVAAHLGWWACRPCFAPVR